MATIHLFGRDWEQLPSRPEPDIEDWFVISFTSQIGVCYDLWMNNAEGYMLLYNFKNGAVYKSTF